MLKTKSRLSQKNKPKKHGKKHARQSRRNVKSSKNRYSGMLGDGCGLLNSVRDKDVRKIYDNYGEYIDHHWTPSTLPCYNGSGKYVPTPDHYSPSDFDNFLSRPRPRIFDGAAYGGY
jgi:hypothetical protein